MKKQNRYEFDFYKELNLPQPITCGLVQRVVSPKKVRTPETDYDYKGIEECHYQLDTELIEIYGYDKGVALAAGLYWVMDIFKQGQNLTWNHYLIILEDDGSVYPVAEYLNCHDSKWVKKGAKIVKAYFNGEDIPAINLTKYKTHKPIKRPARR